MDHHVAEQDDGSAELKDRIEYALTEIRVVIPGAQALLGFQLIGVLPSGFAALPKLSQGIHLASLALVAFSTILLMTPAAYHRLRERGDYSESVHRVASRFMLVAMIPLALGIAGDFLVVTEKITHSYPVAFGGAGVLLLLCFGLWFGLAWFRRATTEEAIRVSAARQRAH